MSNQLLGNVYNLIMNDVIENCQTTFEEDGVNQQTLEDLRSTWQTKLTALHVGSFPWEPQPAPQPMPQPMANPTVPSNVPRPGQVPSNSGPASSNGQPRIKQEPNIEPQQYSGLAPGYSNNVAQERAAQQLQQRYGTDAQAQINRLQQQSAMSRPPQYSQHPSGQPQGGMQRPPLNGPYPPPNQMTDKQRADAMEYHRRQQMSQAPLRPQGPAQGAPQQQPVASNARTDGADDWEDFVLQRRLEDSQAQGNIFESNETLRQHVQQQSKSMEGGGLMMPLSEQPKAHRSKKRKVNTDAGERQSIPYTSLVAAQTSNPSHSLPNVPQLDGHADGDDDEDDKKGIKDELFDDEDDEDAINSDLDDPDDNAIEEEQDEGRPNQIMLCTYDKVQRVKNKWKCTLKDGVLNTGGKDYVFTKANGEFEW